MYNLSVGIILGTVLDEGGGLGVGVGLFIGVEVLVLVFVLVFELGLKVELWVVEFGFVVVLVVDWLGAPEEGFAVDIIT